MKGDMIMKFVLNLANASIMETLEEAARSRELVNVRARQRCLGKTTALFNFARKHNYGVVVHSHMVSFYKHQYPDLRIVSHLNTGGIFTYNNYVCDECVPCEVVYKLKRDGVLVTGFLREDDPLKNIKEPRIGPVTKLLTIELTDEQSIPRVIYKGEEITGRIAIDFEWRTKDADQCGSTYYRIKHTKDSTGAPVVETKELAVGERAYGA